MFAAVVVVVRFETQTVYQVPQLFYALQRLKIKKT